MSVSPDTTSEGWLPFPPWPPPVTEVYDVPIHACTAPGLLNQRKPVPVKVSTATAGSHPVVAVPLPVHPEMVDSVGGPSYAKLMSGAPAVWPFQYPSMVRLQ